MIVLQYLCMKKETRVWFEQAEDDYKNGNLLIKSKSYRGAVLFAQQSVEKILKAYIIEFKNVVPKKTHRIENLIKDADLNINNFNIENIKELSKAYTWVRYPDMSQRFYTKRDITQMLLVVAKKLYLWVKKKFVNN